MVLRRSKPFYSLWCLLIALLKLSACYGYTSRALKDKIDNLPGTEHFDVTFQQFSGYLNVSETKMIHYWFVESMQDPVNDPILFWTNGGPGCSGMLGFFWELGPFKPNSDQTLSLNKYSWNQISNILFVESPCSVGFSYSTATNTDTDYTTGDTLTAHDNYILLQEFYHRFPQYAMNRLYLGSESYGGHYIPQLAQTIVNRNKMSRFPTINLTGITIGNPYTTTYSGSQAMYETLWFHQLYSKPLWDEFELNCKTDFTSDDCYWTTKKIDAQIGERNFYGLDFPMCRLVSDAKHTAEQVVSLLHHIHENRKDKLNARMTSNNGDIKSTFLNPSKSLRYEPCIHDYTRLYLNQPTVKAAIHVKKDITWMKCSEVLQYQYTDMDISMVPIYQYLIDGEYELDILIFSGDDDSVCSTLGTQDWIWNLGYDVSEPAWQTYSVKNQPSGYLTKWKGKKLGFLTVHGAGHEVPMYAPEVAFQMFQDFIAGKLTDG